MNAQGERGAFYAMVRLYECERIAGAISDVKPIYRVDPRKYDNSTQEQHHGLRAIELDTITQKMCKFVDRTEPSLAPGIQSWYF